MIDYSRFKSADMAAVLRLYGELQESPPDLLLRADRMLKGLCRLVNAQVGIFSSLENYRPDQKWRITPLLDLGWTSPEERRWNMSFFEGDQLGDPMTEQCVQRTAPLVTCSRDQLITARDWYKSPNVNELRKRARVDHCIYSNYYLNDSGRAIGIALHRPWGDKPFTPRDLALVDIFHRHQPLYNRQSHLINSSLSPRQRQVLHLLQSGLSEKQIAHHLHLSSHTIHTYVKALYIHFQASSRAELLSRWIQPTPVINFSKM